MTINPEAQALDDLFPDGELVEPSYSDVDRRSEGSPDEKVIAQLAEAAAEVSDESEAAAVMTALSQTPGISESKIAPDVLAKLLPDSEVVVLPQVERVAGGIGYRAVKRVFDVVSCSLALVILAIPMGVIALKIRRESTGPAVYAQRRVGMNGEVFKLYKFRSMYLDAEVSGAQWAEEGDPRVTPLGRKLRRSRLDELPQFWNVLKWMYFGYKKATGARTHSVEYTRSVSCLFGL